MKISSPKLLLYGLAAVIVLAANFFRFHDLDKIPYGFHVDEMMNALNAYCLAHEGIDVQRNPYPLFPASGYGSPKPPVYIYPAVLWGRVFGFEAPSFRAFSAFSFLLFVIGLFLWTRRILGVRAAMWAAVAASISPWPWMYSRMGYESIFELVFMIWGLYFFFRRNTWGNMFLAAIFFACAIYVYPAARLQVPFIIVSAFLLRWSRKEVPWKTLGFVFLAVGILLAPFVMDVLGNKGQLQRINEVAIFSSEVLREAGLKGDFAELWQLFWKNYRMHLSGQFLFLKGGAHMIQSTQAFGILGWLDIWALVIAIFFGVHFLLTGWRKEHIFRRQGGWILFCLANFLFSIVPSALTNSEIPHALRIMSGAIFVFSLTGLFLSEADKACRWAPVVSLLVAGIFLAAFLRVYFFEYPQKSKGMFWFWSQEQARAARTEQDWLKFMVAHYGQDYHVMYYLIFYKGGEGCDSSRTKWERVRDFVSSHPPLR